MIDKSKVENNYGKSYDHTYYDTQTGNTVDIIKIYGWDSFVGSYTSSGTWRVDFNDKSVVWGNFKECSSKAIKMLKEHPDHIEPGNYLILTDKYIDELKKVTEITSEEEKDWRRRVIKCDSITERKNHIKGTLLYIDDTNKIKLGAGIEGIYPNDVKKIRVNEYIKGLKEIK